jgi:Big-like domain-containing protein
MRKNPSNPRLGWILPTLVAGLMILPAQARAADTTGPITTLTAPTLSSASGTVLWSAAATDSSGIDRVEFRVDGALVETDRTAPYRGLWDTTRYTFGSHQVQVRAYDRLGNVTAETTYVNVSNLFAPLAYGVGSFGIVGSDLLRSFDLDRQIHEPARYWAAYAGGDSPEGAFMGWMQPGAATLPATITLPQTLQPGSYWFFVKGYDYGSPIDVNFSIGGGTTTVTPNDDDGNGAWSVAAPVTVRTSSNQLLLTLQKGGSPTVVSKFLLRGLYVTNDVHESVLKYDSVVHLEYPTRMDNSPAQPGNLVENGGFETGLGHGWGLSENRQIPLRSIWDASGGFSSRSSVRLPLSPRAHSYGTGIDLVSKPYSVKPNKKYTLSAWLRTDPGATATGSLSLVNSFADTHLLPAGAPKQHRIDKPFSVGSGWTQVSVTGYLVEYPTADYQVSITGKDNRGRHLWVDGVSLTEGDPVPYSPKVPLEIGLRSAQSSNLYYEDQPVLFRLRAANGSTAPQSATVRYEVYDYMNRNVKSGSVSVSAAPSTTVASDLDLGTGKRGSFRVVLWIDGVEGSEEEVLFGVVPRPQVAGADPSSSMGIHSNFTDFQYEALQKLGIKWDRAMSPGAFFRWSLVEPVDDQIAWYDTNVDAANRRGIQIMGTIGEDGWPAWADVAGKPNLLKWQEFVGQLVSHYRGRVQAWEIWNEPNYTFAPDFYARMVKGAAEAIRKADPEAKVVAMGGAWQPEYTTAVIAELERQFPTWPWRNYLDVFSTHMYPSVEVSAPGSNLGPGEAFQNRVISVYGKPVWNTETGQWDSGFFHTSNAPSVLWGRYLLPFEAGYLYTESSPLAVENVSINFLETIANGMSKYFYYDFRNTPNPALLRNHPSALEYDDTVRPKAIGLSILARLFDHSRGLGPLTSGDEYARALLFDRQGTPLIALYSLDNASRALTLSGLTPQQFKAYDVMGNPLPVSGTTIRFSRQPVYLEGQGISVAALRAAFDGGAIRNVADTLAPYLSINTGPRGQVRFGTAIRFRWGAADDTHTPGPDDPDAISYSYRVAGSPTSGGWSTWSANTYVDLPNLPRGSYVFEVKARDLARNRSAPVSRPFTVG